MEEVETEVLKNELVCEENSKKCSCTELEERSKKAEAKIVELELEIEKRKKEYDALEAKLKELNAQKDAIEDELMAFRTRKFREHGNSFKDENKGNHEEGKEGDVVVDLTEEGEEEDIVDKLVVENHVLECEKRKAESEVEIWKEKFKELELWVSQVDDITKLRGGKQLLLEVIKGENRPDGRTAMEQLQIKEKSVDLADLGATCGIPGEGIDDITAGTPYKKSPCGHTSLVRNKGVCSNSEGDRHGIVVRCLSFEEERSPNKKMAPSTPGSSKTACLNVINILDSDDESDIHATQASTPNDQRNRKVRISKDHMVAGNLNDKKEKTSENSLKRAACNQSYKEDMDDIPCVPTPKRKRAVKIVTSDTESDEDDNVPISKLKRVPLQGSIHDKANTDVSSCSIFGSSPCIHDDFSGLVTRSRRRLATLRQCEEKVNGESKTSESKQGQGIPTMKDVEDGESEEIGSDSEGERLGGFIVDSSDLSDANNGSSQSKNESDDNVDFDEILSKLQRSKNCKFKWELEADMLSAFGKDLELCMKAVCALYRQQTSEEQAGKETIYDNNRGFSKFDALRGTTLAEFLTDGDPHGDLKKSVQQLEERGPKAVELCRSLATHYSKQLFEIYKNKEDPLFLPS
ncbi:hypothetical protein JCGZ_26006 [Jatropha curcas]|uniref:Uncharacterized protein n=2 Tax=Jatropha curcas TaxID=180498 RepID=A0A067JQB2_JATCU|nr:protein IWS1 homolog A isoform X2 [Jatropha curcas]XP_012090120.1 protein IWS1 homolog A isoform X2 [Jatropha curcas]KDP22175.1 hypothetical protein JCGZ_26006 [Jatropha curcas]